MADVRSLLRNERASRRITHPQASYSSTGSLLCLVCRTQIKSESLWTSHLHSTQHTAQLRKAQTTHLQPTPRTVAPSTGNRSNGNKKRKANDDDDEEDARKRTKAVSSLPDGFFDAGGPTEEVEEAEVVKTEDLKDTDPPLGSGPAKQPSLPSHRLTTTKPPQAEPQTIDESEWAAFERDVATPPPSPPRITVLTAAATISAAPLSAAEIAAKERETASTQAKERREAELEGEKEDAARRLDEEFDEMEVLESRVRRLREMWEALRKRNHQEGDGEEGYQEEKQEQEKGLRDEVGGNKVLADGEGEDSGNDEDEDDEDWNGWGLR